VAGSVSDHYRRSRLERSGEAKRAPAPFASASPQRPHQAPVELLGGVVPSATAIPRFSAASRTILSSVRAA
jgi:hypothetical protein